MKNKIQEYRKLNGLSQADLARRAGISEISVRKYEKGDRKPKIETLSKIADALGTPIYNLIDVDLYDVLAESPEVEDEIIDQKFSSILNADIPNNQKKMMAKNLISQVELMSQYHFTNADHASKNLMQALMDSLNSTGQSKAIEQVELLTKIPEYQKKTISKIAKTDNEDIGS